MARSMNIFNGGLSAENNQYKFIPLENLIYNNEYERYEDERYFDMVESIKRNGVLVPLIVSPAENGNYDILSGNNRRYCAEGAGKTEVPCVVKENLTDEEKQAYIDETNVFQRGFNNLKISKQAEVIARRHSTMFSDKKLKEIQREIAKINGEELPEEAEENEITEDENDEKVSKLAAVGREYGLAQASVARLIRISKLVPDLTPYIDSGKIAIRTGVALSYLTENVQIKVSNLVSEGNTVDMKKAQLLRDLSVEGELNDDVIADVIMGNYEKPTEKVKSFRLKSSFLKKHFKTQKSEEEMLNIIDAALMLYFKNNPQEME